MCRPYTPAGGACPSPGECGLDLVTQLQKIKSEDGKPGNLTVEKPGRLRAQGYHHSAGMWISQT